MTPRDFLKDWQHIIVICVGLICATLGVIFVPTERWEKFGRFIADPATAVALSGLGMVFVGLYRRARGLPPAVALLALGAAFSASGCGASAPVVVAGIETGVHFTCQVAREVCSWTEQYMTTDTMRQKHDAACSFIDTACHVVGSKSE